MRSTTIIGTPKDASMHPVIYERRLKMMKGVATEMLIANHKFLVYGGLFSDDAFECLAESIANLILAEHDTKGRRINTMKGIFHQIEQIIESAPDRG